MDARDYRTWTSFADHPIFSDRQGCLDRSTDAKQYDGVPARFLVEWYVHVDPRLPVEEQEVLAARDIGNLISVCSDIEREFGPIDHELFILDDFTVFVHVETAPFVFDVYPIHATDDSVIFLGIDQPRDQDHYLPSPADVVPRLRALTAKT